MILVHVLCWKWRCVTHSLTHSGQRSWFMFSNRTAKIIAVLLTSMLSDFTVHRELFQLATNSACIPLEAALRLPRMIVYYSPCTHRPSVSECEPQGWLMNWMTDRLAAYQFRELESTEQFGEQIFWTNHFNERILEIQYSKKNCCSHHRCSGTLLTV